MTISSKDHFTACRPAYAEGQGMAYTVRPTLPSAIAAGEAEPELPPDSDARKIQSLWKAVIMQAVVDARSRARRGSTRLARRRAENWLYETNYDFEQVCELAGEHPDYIRRQLSSLRRLPVYSPSGMAS